MLTDLIEYLYIIPASLLAIILHEISHGATSYFLGDPTPKEDGRLSLNPLHHIDYVGVICMILFHFGWAKPVKINPQYYKNPKFGIALVSLSGPLCNLILAFISGLIITLSYGKIFIVYKFFYYFLVLNVGLGLFNLIPLPPLDGSKIIGIFIPNSSYEKYMSYQKYGYIFLLVLIVVLDVLSYFGFPSIISTAIDVVSNKILEFWYNIIL